MENKHYGLFNSTVYSESDEKGMITTTSCPQIFRFINKDKTMGYILDVIEIEKDPASEDIKIQYNDDISYVYIEGGVIERQDSFDIRSITCLSPIGRKFKFRGQIKKKIQNIS